jgi:aromatic ring-opening dioxygenase catalytic subunit (LigB family)
MQDNVIQGQTQPFVKLAQANMDLITRFSTSPEVTAQASANAGQLLQQASDSAMKLMQSGAFSHLLQGMMKNYTEFLTELSQSSMALFTQGQAMVTRQVQEATNEAIDATDARGRRARQAA